MMGHDLLLGCLEAAQFLLRTSRAVGHPLALAGVTRRTDRRLMPLV